MVAPIARSRRNCHLSRVEIAGIGLYKRRSMWVIDLFVTNWFLAVFVQSSFHHRYASHRMFTMSEAMERVFHVGTWLVQGSSYLSPRAYAILHREHHAFSDT